MGLSPFTFGGAMRTPVAADTTRVKGEEEKREEVVKILLMHFSERSWFPIKWWALHSALTLFLSLLEQEEFPDLGFTLDHVSERYLALDNIYHDLVHQGLARYDKRAADTLHLQFFPHVRKHIRRHADTGELTTILRIAPTVYAKYKDVCRGVKV